MRDFKKLKVWEKAHELVLLTYAIADEFPDRERYGLVQQLKRAAASIPTNIAEGCGRYGDKEFAHFLNIAAGSACELEYLIILSEDLRYLREFEEDHITELRQLVDEVQKMLTKFQSTLRFAFHS